MDGVLSNPLRIATTLSTAASYCSRKWHYHTTDVSLATFYVTNWYLSEKQITLDYFHILYNKEDQGAFLCPNVKF